LGRMGIKYTTPIYRADCWAHFGLMNKHMALLVVGNMDEKRASKFRALWAKYKYSLVAISEKALEGMSDPDMDAQFTGMLRELGKLTK